MSSRFAWVVVPVLVIGACSSSADVPLDPDPDAAAVVANVGEVFRLKPGQTARVGRDGLVVGFRGVTGDSRCPTDVTCVWQGDATLRIPVSIGRAAWTPLDLHTGVEPRSASFRNYTITVVDLAPQPRSGQSIPNEGYVAVLRVE